MEDELPGMVRRVYEAVSQKLGRPASVRQVKNQEAWFVNDPVMSFIQHGMKKGQTGYRVGYMINPIISEIHFVLVHSPLIATLFKKNLQIDVLIRIINDTRWLRKCDYILWESRRAAKSGKSTIEHMVDEPGELCDILREIEREKGFSKDLFPVRQNTGKSGGKAPVAGNTFYLLLAEHRSLLQTRQQVMDLIDLTWPLMLWLYPQAAIVRRTASLSRSMRVAKITTTCEFASIRLPSALMSDENLACAGSLEAAHIKPHQYGGNDRHENGLWLCQKHHRMTEGRLKGTRNRERVAVRFIAQSIT